MGGGALNECAIMNNLFIALNIQPHNREGLG